MAGIGFGLGGFASAFQQGMRDNSLADYRQQELKLQEQAQKNAEQRFQTTRIDQIRSDAMKNIAEGIESIKIAHPEIGNDQISKQFMPWVEQVAGLTQKSGLDPATVYSQFATALARPPKTQTEAAMAKASDVFGKEAAQAEKTRAEVGLIQSESENIKQFTGAGESKSVIPGAGMTLNPDDPGDLYLATQPEALRQQIKDIAEYRVNPNILPSRTMKGMGTSIREAVMSKVEAYAAARGDPYDQTKFSSRNAALTAGARTAATRAANLEIITETVKTAIPAALAASDKVPRGNWVPINKLAQMAESNISDPNLKEFKTTNLQLAELWAKAMNPTGVMRVDDRNLALDILGTAEGPEAYKRALTTLTGMIGREQSSVKTVLGKMGLSTLLNRNPKALGGEDESGGEKPGEWKIERISP